MTKCNRSCSGVRVTELWRVVVCLRRPRVVECVQPLNEPATHVITDEIRYRLLTYLADHPDASQREVAQHLAVSVGKVNYCLHALIEVGLVKMRNFGKSKRKQAYVYVLTPSGIEEKMNVTVRFLRQKMDEYDALSTEISRLTCELGGVEPAPQTDEPTL